MIRPARSGEAKALSDLALRSKAHWGYDAAFMAACRAELTVTPAQAASGRAYLYEARRLELAKVRVPSDPNAEAFYRAMGATTVGTAPSGSIPGRRLPLMELALGEES